MRLWFVPIILLLGLLWLLGSPGTSSILQANMDSFVESAAMQPEMGDVSCDDIINSVDALFILQYELGLRGGSEDCSSPQRQERAVNMASCDVNNDDNCGSVDALLILQCDISIFNRFCPDDASRPETTEVEPNRAFAFECGRGLTLVPISLVPGSDTGYNAERLYDNDEYLGWSTGLNGNAEAQFTLSGSGQTVREIHVYVSPNQPSTGDISFKLLDNNNSSLGSGSVSSATGGWNTTAVNIPGADLIEIARNSGENIFEMRICAGGTPPTDTPTPTQAIGSGFGSFQCGRGLSLESLTLVPGTDTGYHAARLYDNNEYLGWSTGLNGSAQAEFTLGGGSETVREVHVYVNPNIASTGTIDFDLFNSSGGIEGTGNVASATSGWHTAQVNIAGASSIGITRDVDENIFEMRICVEASDPDTPTPTSTLTPTPTPTSTSQSPGDCEPSLAFNTADLPRSTTAQNSGCLPSHSVVDKNDDHHWSNQTGVPPLSDPCIDLHDSFWVLADDNENDDNTDENAAKVYFTYHEPIEYLSDGTACVFEHEHGLDPSVSMLFDYWGGWPAFGFVAQEFSEANPDMPRHEDHFGHKVTIATYRAAIGNPPNQNKAIYDAGFFCHFMSKIHQGSRTTDAFTNQLHEYYLTVRCDDNPDGLMDRMDDSYQDRLDDDANIRTQFSIKTMVPYGKNDEFLNICGNHIIVPQPNTMGFDGSLIEASRNPGIMVDYIDLSKMPGDVIEPNPREFGCFEQWNQKFRFGTVETIDQLDLWTQHKAVVAPKPTDDASASYPRVIFHAYYAVNDPVRVYSPFTGQATYTVDLCQHILQLLPDHRFCSGVTSDMTPFSPDSPFKGAYRVIHFKDFAINSNVSTRDEAFCANTLGRIPSDSNGDTCSGEHNILQKIKPFDGDNEWNAWTNPVTDISGQVQGSLYVVGQEVRYTHQPGTEQNYIIVNGDEPLPGLPEETGLLRPDGSNQCPLGAVSYPHGTAHAYCAGGIGFERAIDRR